MIELKNIDTSVAEKNIIQLLEKNETYFLNGAWGSGKTVLLKKVSDNIASYKLVELNLWEIKDERSVIEIAFSKLFRCLYWSIKLSIVLAVVISILTTPLVDLGLSHYFQEFIAFAGFISLVVTVWQFFKYKSDDIYRFLFTKLSLKNKILVVDDFDRISPERQEDLYRLFNILRGHMPIVFVGDYTKVSHSKENYLKKIIDKRLELPIVLHPKNIWNDYFNDLSIQLETSFSSEFLNIFVEENRNLRDRKQFNDLVTQEFYKRGKLYHVQVEQQLCVLYLYLFYPEKYQLLRDGGMFEHSKEYQEYLNDEDKTWYDIEPQKTSDDVFKLLLSSNNNYPPSFSDRHETYLLYESVSNLSITEAKRILKDHEQLEKMLSEENSYFEDFYQFITASYSSFTHEKEILVFLSLKLIKENQTNKLLVYIITQKNYDIMPPKVFLGGRSDTLSWGIPEEWGSRTEEEISKIILKEWEKILDNSQYDFSQKLYFFEELLRISFLELGSSYSELSLDSEEYINGKCKDFYFLTYLSNKNLWYSLNEWSDELWSKMDLLSNKEYLYVLTNNQIISPCTSYSYDSISYQKNYFVYFKIQSYNNPNHYSDYTDEIEKYIRPRLNKMTTEGYHFDYKTNKFD